MKPELRKYLQELLDKPDTEAAISVQQDVQATEFMPGRSPWTSQFVREPQKFVITITLENPGDFQEFLQPSIGPIYSNHPMYGKKSRYEG